MGNLSLIPCLAGVCAGHASDQTICAGTTSDGGDRNLFVDDTLKLLAVHDLFF
jgi:hypothetical protein